MLCAACALTVRAADTLPAVSTSKPLFSSSVSTVPAKGTLS